MPGAVCPGSRETFRCGHFSLLLLLVCEANVGDDGADFVIVPGMAGIHFAHPRLQDADGLSILQFFSLKTPDCNHDEQDGHHRGADDWCDGVQRLTLDQRNRQGRLPSYFHD